MQYKSLSTQNLVIQCDAMQVGFVINFRLWKIYGIFFFCSAHNFHPLVRTSIGRISLEEGMYVCARVQSTIFYTCIWFTFCNLLQEEGPCCDAAAALVYSSQVSGCGYRPSMPDQFY